MSKPLYAESCKDCQLVYPPNTLFCKNCNKPLTLLDFNASPWINVSEIPPEGMTQKDFWKKIKVGPDWERIGYWALRIIIFVVLSAIVSGIAWWFS